MPIDVNALVNKVNLTSKQKADLALANLNSEATTAELGNALLDCAAADRAITATQLPIIYDPTACDKKDLE